MRKVALLLTLLILALALPTSADERHQSYISYDDGGTVVRTGDEGKEIEAHRNLPIYPGDEIITARRGRTEVRLSDGNVIGIDRTTALQFRSILDSYDGDDEETIAELKYGKVAIYRTDIGRDRVRLDTQYASYVADHEAIYSVDSDSKGTDRVTVFEGSVEVRTPRRATRLRAGESAKVDDQGAYDLIGDQRAAADDFEQWFIRRAERLDGRSTKYVDRRLSYWNDDLDDYGRWVFLNGIGWSWRPYVAVGWRPYYHGYWHHGRNGCLTWVSYDPWGWGPYHYGRWAFDPGFGWVWVPGYGYSPAWVYWWYGPSYIGWAPAGWWDCHRGYYDWAYRPYRSRDFFGFGFYGRVRVGDMDLRPWTFLDSRTIVSNRVDRAALTTDAIKQRLGRSGGGFATVGSEPARFTRQELPDPADAIRRRGLDGRHTGRETGAPPTDLTPFFRRDGDVSSTIRDRIVRSRPANPGGGGSAGTVTVGGTVTRRSGGGIAPIDGGGLAPIGRGGLAPIDGGSGVAPIPGSSPTTPSTGGSTPSTGGIENRRGGSGGINRGGSTPSEPSTRDSGNSNDNGSRGSGTWRGRLGDRGNDRPAVTPPPSDSTTPTPSESTRPRNDSWRGRVRNDSPQSSDPSSSSGSSTRESGSSDVSRRVIDGIGGARVYPSDRDDRSTRSRDNDSSRSSDSGSVRGRDSGSRDSGSRDTYRSRPQNDSGSRSSGGSTRDSGSSTRSSGSSSGSRSNDSGSRSSGNRSSGGKIKRD